MFVLVILFSIVLFLLYYYTTENHNYWAKRNVKYDKPVPFFGNIYQNVIGLKSITEVSIELYNKYPDEKVVGFYRGRIPELLIRDLDVVRRILNVDFAYFYERGIGRDSDQEPALASLFHVEGDTWKLLRQRLTGAFTTAKLKKMFPIVIECAKRLNNVADDIVKNRNGECDVRELMARFTTDFIGACGFGIQIDSINNEKSRFRELGRKLFNRSWKNIVITTIWDLLPEIRRPVQKLFAENEFINDIEVILSNLRVQRNNKPSGRNDFVDLLLELEAKGRIVGDSIENISPDGKPMLANIEMDNKLMAAQMFVFFVAGFETSSSATSYTLHELAFHPDIQVKIQNEIDIVLKRYNNQLCYDSISDMTLLSNAFKEALRLFPSLGVLHRRCARRYTIPELGVTIDPGVKLIVPVQAIQNDEKYFADPLQFRPERFEEMSERHKYSYLPFGEGPRQCIGARLGEMQSLAGLAVVLQRFTVEPASTTKRRLEINHKSNVVQGVLGGLPLKLKLRSVHTSP